MKLSTLAIATAIGAMCASGPLLAGKKDNDIIDDDLTRRPAGGTSGSGDTVEANCGGPDYQGSTGKLVIAQSSVGESTVEVEIEDAVPGTHFTIWTRIKGGTGYNDSGSPWTGGGATPLCSGTEFDSLNDNSPWNNAAGTTDELCNSFYTDGSGTGTFKASVNFPVVGGAYPFQQSGDTDAGPGGDDIPDVPTAIVDPRTGNGGPFLIRVVSHCTDNANHGLSPSTREAWFQYP